MPPRRGLMDLGASRAINMAPRWGLPFARQVAAVKSKHVASQAGLNTLFTLFQHRAFRGEL